MMEKTNLFAGNGQSAVERLSQAIADYQSRDWTDKTIFLNTRFDEAKAELAAWQALGEKRSYLPPLAGYTMTVKACFDRKDWVRSCASKVKINNAPAEKSASIVESLERLGATVIAQTNMTEFAYGALGVNGSFGTSRSPLYEAEDRVAGGSSSGAAVAVARGYSDFALCSDTSGSARIPAAFCGVAGFKPSRGRYPSDGMGWLSTTFDVPGIIASSAQLIEEVDVALTGTSAPAVEVARLRFVVPAELDALELDDAVRVEFAGALKRLEKAGVTIVKLSLPQLFDSARIAAEGGVISAEAFAVHQKDLETSFDLYDVKVGPRVKNGEAVPAYRYLRALADLEICKTDFDSAIRGFDGFLLPTVPMLPPQLEPLADMDTYLKANIRSFSLTEPANRLDLPSISLPLSGQAIGLMITGTRGGDSATLVMGTALSTLL
jgi:aspartyl-tRNA(Asn)/glutamyl-tRNA(Gln) amidotransferase subunit A